MQEQVLKPWQVGEITVEGLTFTIRRAYPNHFYGNCDRAWLAYNGSLIDRMYSTRVLVCGKHPGTMESIRKLLEVAMEERRGYAAEQHEAQERHAFQRRAIDNFEALQRDADLLLGTVRDTQRHWNSPAQWEALEEAASTLLATLRASRGEA